MRPKEYSVQEVYNNTLIGLQFEFYSSKKSNFIVEDLSRPLGRKVILTENENIPPTWSSPILLKEYNGKKPRYQLKIAQQDYQALNPAVGQILKWINENAALDYSTILGVSLSFKNRNLQTLTNISTMDIGKMVLKIDENFLYNKFPLMESSPFCLSMKRVLPLEGFINVSNPLGSLKNYFQIPISEDYGVDFTEQPMGILKFNYIGGPKYAQKPYEVSETLKYYIISTYQVLNSEGYTPEMKFEMDKLTENYSRIRRCYYEPDYFIDAYPGIKVLVDLKESDQIVKTYWEKIRGPLLRLIMESGFDKGYFNWDTDQGKFDIKDAKLEGVKVSGMNLVNCEVRGLLEDCHMWRSSAENSLIRNSTIVAGTDIKTSLLEGCRADRSNTIERSYIINKGEIINCEVNESVIKNAGIGQNAKLDEECTIIEDRLPKTPAPEGGIKVEEIRDYRWLKSMKQGEDQGFGNEFEIKY